MPFYDATKTLIEQSIELARAELLQERITLAWTYEDYLAGQQLEHMAALTGAKGVKYNELTKITFPFTDTILTELSKLYKTQPQRYFDSERPSAKTKRAWVPSKYDLALQGWQRKAEDDESDYGPTFVMLDKRTRLHGRTIVRVWPAFDKGSPEDKAGKNYPRFDCFHPGQYDVICDNRSPSRPIAVILYLSNTNAAVGHNHIQIWTAEESVDIINGVTQKGVPNPVKELPFISFGNYIDPQEYWQAGYANRIVPQNALFDLGWTHLFALMVNQAHGQPWAKNADTKWAKSPKWGWDTIVMLDDDGDFGFANATANMRDMIDVLEKIIERVYWMCGLPSNKIKDAAIPESGVAYRVKNASVLEDREQRASLFAPRERALWLLAFKVGAAFGMHTISNPPKEAIIEYAPPEIPVPQSEAQAERDWNLTKNITSVIDEYRKMHPDTQDDEQAIEELKYNAKANAALLGVPATLKDFMNAAAKNVPTAGDDVEDEIDEQTEEEQENPK